MDAIRRAALEVLHDRHLAPVFLGRKRHTLLVDNCAQDGHTHAKRIHTWATSSLHFEHVHHDGRAIDWRQLDSLRLVWNVRWWRPRGRWRWSTGWWRPGWRWRRRRRQWRGWRGRRRRGRRRWLRWAWQDLDRRLALELEVKHAPPEALGGAVPAVSPAGAMLHVGVASFTVAVVVPARAPERLGQLPEAHVRRARRRQERRAARRRWRNGR